MIVVKDRLHNKFSCDAAATRLPCVSFVRSQPLPPLVVEHVPHLLAAEGEGAEEVRDVFLLLRGLVRGWLVVQGRVKLLVVDWAIVLFVVVPLVVVLLHQGDVARLGRLVVNCWRGRS